MKSYLLIILVLIAIGVALAVQVFNQDQRLDETVFLQTTESIRNLQSADESLLRLLQQSRLNRDFEHDLLSDTNYEISEEFDTLRFEALFEEIEGSPELNSAVNLYEDAFATREELLEQYIANNQSLNENLFEFKNSLMIENSGNKSDVEIKYLEVSNLLYQSVLDHTNDDSNRDVLMAKIDSIETVQSIQMPNLSDFKASAEAVLKSDSSSRANFSELQNLNTGQLLDQIENGYTNYHNAAIENANQLRNALIFYGFALLAALLFFGYLIRRNFLSLEQQVHERTTEIATAYSELKESQEQLIQSEKMASLGEMVAGVAHEINTPLGYVSSNVDTIKLNMNDLREVIDGFDAVYREAISKEKDQARLTAKLVKALKSYQKSDVIDVFEESDQLLDDGSYGLSEISGLVTSLKDFSRLDRQSSEEIDIHDCIENSLTIGSNHIKENNISIQKSFSSLPKLSCTPSKLNQVFLNIITNACQSMKGEGGTLEIITEHEGGDLVVQFKDEGEGIEPDALQKIFDPFFTTKDVGQGTGLGLSIAYKIVKQHGGEITVKSIVGVGTAITVRLPVDQISLAA